MVAALPVVLSGQHIGHAPIVEVQCGTPIPAFDQVRRIDAITRELDRDGGYTFIEPQHHGLDPVLAVHDHALVEFLSEAWDLSTPWRPEGASLIFGDTFHHVELTRHLGSPDDETPMSSPGVMGRFCFDTITGIGSTTWSAAAASTDVALTAAGRILGRDHFSLALTRPPGHHATRRMFGGGTYLNNAAIAAQMLVDGGARVAVVDVDYHHGNGTQAIFYDRADVLYVSLHGHPDRAYPYFTGRPAERGAGPGKNANVNLTLPLHVNVAQYLEILELAAAAVADHAATHLVISLGFDALEGDPSGDGGLCPDDFHAVGARLAQLGLPTVAILEGGYLLDQIGPAVAGFCDGALSGLAVGS